MADVRVRINVGGKIFETWKSTILKYPDTILAKAISEKWTPANELFFDRNPKVFTAILDYYRNGMLRRPLNVNAEIFFEEVKFWGIEVEKTIDDYINWEEVQKEEIMRQLPESSAVKYIVNNFKIENGRSYVKLFCEDPEKNELPFLEKIKYKKEKLCVTDQLNICKEILERYFYFSSVEIGEAEFSDDGKFVYDRRTFDFGPRINDVLIFTEGKRRYVRFIYFKP